MDLSRDPSRPRPGRWWHGPPPALPDLADRAAERWFALPPRARAGAAVAATLTVLLLAGAGAARSPWGPPVDVVVAARDLPAGATLDPAAVEVRRHPQGLVPPDALRRDDDLTGRLTATVLAGTLLTERHLAGHDGVAPGLAPGRAAFPLDAALLPPLQPGQRVDLVAGDVEGRGRTLARDARVVTVADGTVWLDVAREEAAGLAAAAAWDGLRVALLPP